MRSRRLFIALSVGEEVQAAADELAAFWKPKLPFRKWVHPEDRHVTLKFLGDTPEEELEKVIEQLEQTAGHHRAIPLKAALPGTFGRPASPSILWLGAAGRGDGDARLHALQKEIEEAMLAVGFPKEEKRFKPHITLARHWSGEVPFRKEMIAVPGHWQPPVWTAGEFVLYESHLNRSPMYEALRRFAL